MSNTNMCEPRFDFVRVEWGALGHNAHRDIRKSLNAKAIRELHPPAQVID